MRATPECLRDASCGGAIKIDYLYIYLYRCRLWPSSFSVALSNIQWACMNYIEHWPFSRKRIKQNISSRFEVTPLKPRWVKRPGDLDLWPFDLESGVRVTCDMGYLCANFSLPRPLCSRVRSDVRDRQTSDSIIA